VPKPDLFIIDAIGPFFCCYDKRVINWSKIPFASLESGDGLDQSKLQRITEAFERFIERIAEEGFSAISIDDIAHMVSFDFYPDPLKRKLAQYRELYRTLFSMVSSRGLRIFVNSDILFFNDSLVKVVGNSISKATELLSEACATLFSDFQVDGVILRIGETDGTDVQGDFKSRLLVRTPAAANQLIKGLLPTIEAYRKRLIFRTWTVGSYPIGDLIWNAGTFGRAFAGIHSRSFIVSMKYGDTDFFSSLEVNPLFYQLRDRPIILELQARRERELFGNLPCFVGWDYHAYARQLKGLRNLVGVSVWCQTGGWSRNRQLTFLENSSVWNELNTIAAIRIFRDQQEPDAILESCLRDREQAEFLKQYHQLLYRLLYLRGFAEKRLFFRRTRIPPLVWLAWDYVTVNPLINSLYQEFSDRNVDVAEADIEAVRRLGLSAGIDRVDFYCDTLQLFLTCVHVITGRLEMAELEKAIAGYRAVHSDCNLKFKLGSGEASRGWLERLLPLLVRDGADYRWIDRIMLSPAFSWLQLKLLNRLSRDMLPKYANKRAMEADALFK